MTTRPHEVYFICPTKELAAYTNMVMGMVAISATMGGKLPDISPDTGEPLYDGTTAAMLAAARERAKVARFDEAAAQCQKGRRRTGITVMNNRDPDYIWLFDGHTSFWAPKFAASQR